MVAMVQRRIESPGTPNEKEYFKGVLMDRSATMEEQW